MDSLSCKNILLSSQNKAKLRVEEGLTQVKEHINYSVIAAVVLGHRNK